MLALQHSLKNDVVSVIITDIMSPDTFSIHTVEGWETTPVREVESPTVITYGAGVQHLYKFEGGSMVNKGTYINGSAIWPKLIYGEDRVTGYPTFSVVRLKNSDNAVYEMKIVDGSAHAFLIRQTMDTVTWAWDSPWEIRRIMPIAGPSFFHLKSVVSRETIDTPVRSLYTTSDISTCESLVSYAYEYIGDVFIACDDVRSNSLAVTVSIATLGDVYPVRITTKWVDDRTLAVINSGMNHPTMLLDIRNTALYEVPSYHPYSSRHHHVSFPKETVYY